jgi:hypothetical protein
MPSGNPNLKLEKKRKEEILLPHEFAIPIIKLFICVFILCSFKNKFVLKVVKVSGNAS